MPILSTLRKLRQEDSCIFKASLFYIVSSRKARIIYKTMSQNKEGKEGVKKGENKEEKEGEKEGEERVRGGGREGGKRGREERNNREREGVSFSEHHT